MLQSSGLTQTRGSGALAIAVALGAFAACAIVASLLRLSVAGRHEAEREAEMDDWAHSGLS